MTTLTSPKAEGDRSLAPIREAIPSHCFERSTARGLVAVAIDVSMWIAVMAALAMVDRWWLVVPLELLAGLVVSALFILGHDAAHGALVASPRLNRILGRILFLPSLHVYEAWVLGHNRVHHGFTTRQNMDFVWHPLTVGEYRELSAMARLRHRIEWSWVGSGAYYLREVWWNKMMRFDPPAKHAAAIRRDWWLVVSWAAAATAGSAALGLALGGSWWAAVAMALKLVVVPFLLFSGIIGWTVYVHHVGPDIRWWTAKEWTRRRAQTESTTILRVPRVLDVFFHNIFVHVPHHVDTRIPFYRLAEAAEAIEASVGDVIVDEPLRLREYLAATRACKLYDFDEGRWLGYDAAR
ncbi:MAG: fatty acid desaturase [Actinomycetota bacterium]|nr:fatty acid desaturase [Actinomycetota bacterium]